MLSIPVALILSTFLTVAQIIRFIQDKPQKPRPNNSPSHLTAVTLYILLFPLVNPTLYSLFLSPTLVVMMDASCTSPLSSSSRSNTYYTY